MTPSRSPNSSSPSRAGTSGESASTAPRPNSALIATATPTSPPSRSSRPASAIATAATITPPPRPSSSGAPASEATTSPGSIACEIDSAA